MAQNDLPQGWTSQGKVPQPDEADSGLPEGWTLQKIPATPTDLGTYYTTDIGKGIIGGAARAGYGLAGTGGDIREGIATGINNLHDFLAANGWVSPEHSDEFRSQVAKTVEAYRKLAGGPWPARVGPVSLAGPTSEDIAQNVAKRTGFYPPQPESIPGQYAQTMTEFLPSAAVAGPEGWLGNALKYGAFPGAVSETAGQVTKDTPLEPWARTAGALTAGAVAPMTIGAPKPIPAFLRDKLPSFVTEQHINAAEKLIQDAASGPNPINLTWPEALSQVTGRPVLTNVQRMVESAPQSREAMGEVFSERPEQIQKRAQQEFSALGPQSKAPSTIGPRVGGAAEDMINAVRKRINDYTDPLYQKAAGTLLNGKEMLKVVQIPGFQAAANKVANDPQLNRYVKNLPPNSVGFLNEVKKVLDTEADTEEHPANVQGNRQRAAGLRSDAFAVRDAALQSEARQGLSSYRDALDVQLNARQRYLDPLMQGPLGNMAKVDVTTQRAIDVLFPERALPGSEQEVGQAIRAVAARNPYAARELVRAHLEQKLDESFNAAGRGQEAAQFAGASFAQRAAGSPVIDSQKFENLKNAVTNLPNGQQTWDGFQRFLDVMRATGTRMPKGSMTAFNEKEMQQLSGTPGITGLGALKEAASPERWMNLAHDYIGRWQQGRNLNGLAKLLTDPDAADTFRKIATVPPDSRQAVLLVSRLVAQGLRGSQEPSERRAQPQQPRQ
jgi:hypothetical protein